MLRGARLWESSQVVGLGQTQPCVKKIPVRASVQKVTKRGADKSGTSQCRKVSFPNVSVHLATVNA